MRWSALSITSTASTLKVADAQKCVPTGQSCDDIHKTCFCLFFRQEFKAGGYARFAGMALVFGMARATTLGRPYRFGLD
jgi:hypothetical protein